MLRTTDDAESRGFTTREPSVISDTGVPGTEAGSAPSATVVTTSKKPRSFLNLRSRSDDADTPGVGRLLSPWREAAILVVIWALYTATRNTADDSDGLAFRHAATILHIEKVFHLNVEASLNTALSHELWLAIAASYWYSLSHYLVTVATLIALYRLRPHSYGWLRTSLGLATVVALACYVLYPTAPPRLTGGYADTLVTTSHYGWWSNHASIPRGLGGASNELAAMPSMHAGWALWCTIVLFGLARHHWQRALAVAYSVAMSLVVIGTANHWVLDLVVGWAIVLAAIFATRAYVLRRAPLAASG